MCKFLNNFNAALKNVFVAVVEMRCYAAVQRDLSDLQRFVPREPGETRNYRSEVGGLSDSQVCELLEECYTVQQCVFEGISNRPKSSALTQNAVR